MSNRLRATLVAAYLANGGEVHVCPTMWANGALRCRVHHMASR